MILTMETSIIHVLFGQLDFLLVAVGYISHSATRIYVVYGFNWTAVFGILNHLIFLPLLLGCDALLPEIRLMVTKFISSTTILDLTVQLVVLATGSLDFEEGQDFE